MLPERRASTESIDDNMVIEYYGLDEVRIYDDQYTLGLYCRNSFNDIQQAALASFLYLGRV